MLAIDRILYMHRKLDHSRNFIASVSKLPIVRLCTSPVITIYGGPPVSVALLSTRCHKSHGVSFDSITDTSKFIVHLNTTNIRLLGRLKIQ